LRLLPSACRPFDQIDSASAGATCRTSTAAIERIMMDVRIKQANMPRVDFRVSGSNETVTTVGWMNRSAKKAALPEMVVRYLQPIAKGKKSSRSRSSRASNTGVVLSLTTLGNQPSDVDRR
jgi:hypothetical protein